MSEGENENKADCSISLVSDQRKFSEIRINVGRGMPSFETRKSIEMAAMDKEQRCRMIRLETFAFKRFAT